MAFNTLDPNDIIAGKPTKKSIFTTIKDNEDDLDGRVGALEAGAAKIDIFISEIANLGQYTNGGSLDRIMLFRASRDLTIVNAQIYVLSDSSGNPPTGGTLEFDIRVGNDPGSLSTVFNTRPSTTGTAEGSTNSSVDFIADGELINQSQWIALDITNLQTGQSRVMIDIFAEPR